MEAAILKKKKTSISKGKIKKTIKNVICRPEPIHWPVTTEDERKELESVLCKYSIDIPEFKKPHWNDLKNIPKKDRPKPPPVKKVDGITFGLSECRNLLYNNQLAAVILEAGINPKSIVQPLLEVCSNTQVPIICLTGLKKISLANFGISTSCLGVKKEFLKDLTKAITLISNNHKPLNTNKSLNQIQATNDGNGNHNIKDDVDVKMKSVSKNEKEAPGIPNNVPCYSYLYRTNKKRVFIPSNVVRANTISNQFVGQDFIEFSNKVNKAKESKAYMKMVVKRIANNPNREKIKQ